MGASEVILATGAESEVLVSGKISEALEACREGCWLVSSSVLASIHRDTQVSAWSNGEGSHADTLNNPFISAQYVQLCS